jgi:hypothetical protein
MNWGIVWTLIGTAAVWVAIAYAGIKCIGG